jgi:hypothetical protein
LICEPCKNNCEIELYHENFLNALTYFILGVREKKIEYLNAIQEPKKYAGFDENIDILANYKYNGYNVLETGPFCQRL